MPGAPHLNKALLTAWLLLLLRDGQQHGWGLNAKLRERAITVDPVRIYRGLHQLEAQGAVSSRWTPSVGGPQRRAYHLTRKGRRTLDELIAQHTATWQTHEAFLDARKHTRDDAREPPVDAPPAASDPPPSNVSRELLAAWLLLLLDRHASYGYDLRRALDDHRVHTDPPAMYRVLGKLERSGWLQSRWMDSVAGPRRRFYRVTTTGRRNLAELSPLIRAARDGYAAFLNAAEDPREASGHGAP